MPTSNEALMAAVEREIAAAVRDGHVGYVDLRITVESGEADAARQIIVVEATRQPRDAPPPGGDVWRIELPQATGGVSRATNLTDVLDGLLGAIGGSADPAVGSAQQPHEPVRVDALRRALDDLAAAVTSAGDLDTVDVVLVPDASAPGPRRARFVREGAARYRFDGALEIDREFIADTTTHAHLRAWLCETLGPRCLAVEVHEVVDGRVARVTVHARTDATPAGGTGERAS